MFIHKNDSTPKKEETTEKKGKQKYPWRPLKLKKGKKIKTN